MLVQKNKKNFQHIARENFNPRKLFLVTFRKSHYRDFVFFFQLASTNENFTPVLVWIRHKLRKKNKTRLL